MRKIICFLTLTLLLTGCGPVTPMTESPQTPELPVSQRTPTEPPAPSAPPETEITVTPETTPDDTSPRFQWPPPSVTFTDYAGCTRAVADGAARYLSEADGYEPSAGEIEAIGSAEGQLLLLMTLEQALKAFAFHIYGDSAQYRLHGYDFDGFQYFEITSETTQSEFVWSNGRLALLDRLEGLLRPPDESDVAYQTLCEVISQLQTAGYMPVEISASDREHIPIPNVNLIGTP